MHIHGLLSCINELWIYNNCDDDDENSIQDDEYIMDLFQLRNLVCRKKKENWLYNDEERNIFLNIFLLSKQNLVM